MRCTPSSTRWCRGERWLGDADALFLPRDRADPLVALPWQTWGRLVPGCCGQRQWQPIQKTAYWRRRADARQNSAPAGSAGDPEAIAVDQLIEPTYGDFAETAAIAQSSKAIHPPPPVFGSAPPLQARYAPSAAGRRRRRG
jgi:hypothetical protein